MAGKNVQVFNSVNFESDVLKSDVPVLVDFTATWCGPCKALAPIVEKLADEFQGKVKVAAGPWGLEEEWWTDSPTGRDYWDVELEGGGIYRLYRDRATGEWWADGIYD